MNKTEVEGEKVVIKSTSFNALIDYDLFTNDNDKCLVAKHFKKDKFRFVLSKLMVRFKNSAIVDFKSFAFLKVPNLFDDKVEIDEIPLSHNGESSNEGIPNLIRLKGTYQKSGEREEFIFSVKKKLLITFKNNLLENINVNKIT